MSISSSLLDQAKNERIYAKQIRKVAKRFHDKVLFENLQNIAKDHENLGASLEHGVEIPNRAMKH